jgi:hypothetical protein
MIRVGFLSRVLPFLWRDDLRKMIKDTPEWLEDPFQFRLYPGSISCNKKGMMAPVLMVEIERDNVSLGLDFFRNNFDGENPVSIQVYSGHLSSIPQSNQREPGNRQDREAWTYATRRSRAYSTERYVVVVLYYVTQALRQPT